MRALVGQRALPVEVVVLVRAVAVDVVAPRMKAADEQFAMAANAIGAGRRVDQLTRTVRADVVEGLELIRRGADDDDRIATDLVGEKRSEERSVGEEGVRTGRYWWSTFH